MVWVIRLLLVHLGLARGFLLNIRFSFRIYNSEGLVLFDYRSLTVKLIPKQATCENRIKSIER